MSIHSTEKDQARQGEGSLLSVLPSTPFRCMINSMPVPVLRRSPMPGKKLRDCALSLIFVWLVCCASAFAHTPGGCAAERYPAVALDAARRLVRAYPEAALSVIGEEDGLYLLADRGEGKRFLFMPAESCPDTHPDAPLDAPLCAMFTHPYPAGPGGRYPEPGFDPGRIRNQAFLQFLYGENAAAVEKNLVTVTVMGEAWRFSSRHGAADALRRVAARLDAAVRADPALTAYILPGAGTYNWRTIKNSPRLSAHSFGVSMDLNVEKGLYWQWNPSKEAVAATRRDYPQAIVDAFEAEGFIWGGKWHSFDFMHFEYRPELFGSAGVAP